MQTTWIIAADSSRARILEMTGQGKPLQELDDLINPVGREQDHEVGRDERGRFYGSVGTPGQGSTGEPHHSLVEHSNELFAGTVADYLDKGRLDHRYSHLYIVAAPKFLGLLRSNLNKEVKKLVEKDLPYDISNFNERQIAEFVTKKMGLH
jgi:protein required for attachment to host cells